MTIPIVEAGKKISAANQAAIRAAVAELLKLIDPSDDGEVKEAAKTKVVGASDKAGTKQNTDDHDALTIEAVRSGLQKLIDLLSPKAAEDLEGDGDGDDDPDKALLQGHVGGLISGKGFYAGNEAKREELLTTLLHLQERAFTTEQRVALAKSGKAIPVKNDKGEIVNGRYPIENDDDLVAAKHRIGTGKDSDKTEIVSHINKRASELGKPKVGEKSKKKDDETKEAAIPISPSAAAGLFLREIFKYGTEPTPTRVQTAFELYGENLKEAAKKQAGMVCASCKEPVENTWDSFCGNCGTSLRGSKKNGYCSGCGCSLDSDDNYCPSCGTKRAVSATESAISEPANLKEGARISNLQLVEAFIPIREKAFGRDGTGMIKIISPGWGTSGYYSRDVIERDIPKVYPTGTKMYWNHATPTEEAERPERDLRDLAAVTMAEPVYLEEGPDGEGSYVSIKPISTYKETIEEIAPHIGVSICGSGDGTFGEALGKKGTIVEQITHGKTIDFVTEPGRGGSIVQLFESARQRSRVAEPQEVKTNDMASEQELKEARDRNVELEGELKKIRARVLVREARDFVAEVIGKDESLPAPVAAALIERLEKEPILDDDGEIDKKAYRAKIKEAVKKESDYIESVFRTGGVRGMGSNTVELGAYDGGDSKEESEENFFTESARWGRDAAVNKTLDLSEQFKRIGLNEATAKQAARGHGRA